LFPDKQLATPGSFLAKLNESAFERNLFVKAGFLGTGSTAIMAMAAVFLGRETAMMTIHLTMIAGCAFAVSKLATDRAVQARTRAFMSTIVYDIKSVFFIRSLTSSRRL